MLNLSMREELAEVKRKYEELEWELASNEELTEEEKADMELAMEELNEEAVRLMDEIREWEAFGGNELRRVGMSMRDFL